MRFLGMYEYPFDAAPLQVADRLSYHLDPEAALPMRPVEEITILESTQYIRVVPVRMHAEQHVSNHHTVIANYKDLQHSAAFQGFIHLNVRTHRHPLFVTSYFVVVKYPEGMRVGIILIPSFQLVGNHGLNDRISTTMEIRSSLPLLMTS